LLLLSYSNASPDVLLIDIPDILIDVAEKEVYTSLEKDVKCVSL
jgi:hypothetical protein